MARTTEHGEPVKRVEFSASQTNWDFLNTNEQARLNKSNFLNKLLDFFRTVKADKTEELQLIREKEELEKQREIQLNSFDNRLKKICAKLTHIHYAKKREEENQLKNIIEQDKKLFCKKCGSKIDNINSAYGKQQTCKNCQWDPTLIKEQLNAKRALNAEVKP